MRLNSDCVRDILLMVEEKVDYHRIFELEFGDSLPTKLKKYSNEELLYHIRQCNLANLIIEPHFFDGGKYVTISDLSPDGHQFLANIRNDNIWGKVKKIAGVVGSNSLSAVTQIASNVITELIKAQFQIT